MLNEVGPDLWTEHHDVIVDEFSFGEERLLVAYMDSINGFVIEYKVCINNTFITCYSWWLKVSASSLLMYCLKMTPTNDVHAIWYCDKEMCSNYA